MMKKIIAIVLLVCVVAIAGAFTYIVQTQYTGEIFYVKIVSDGERIVREGMVDYIYELEGINKNGERKTFNFRANRETPLTRDRFIALEYNEIRGVLTWNGIEFEDMPLSVQDFYR